MRATVVIPTFNAVGLLSEALDRPGGSDRPPRRRRGRQRVDRRDGRDPRGALPAGVGRPAATRTRASAGPSTAASPRSTTEAVVLINNDVVCEPGFLEQLLAPLADERVSSVAGVLLQHGRPELIDTAGIELDTTLRSWDALWNRPVAELASAAEPVGPCGGAAAYRTAAFREVGGFDETFFAYWEDVDLALRLRLAGHRCVRAPAAQALHKHGQTLGAASPAQRRLEAFGRGYVLAHFRVARHGLATRAKIAALDWPVLVVHLVVRRELDPIRERRRGTRAGLARPPLRAPFELATVSFREALSRQLGLLRLRASGNLPSHFDEHVSGAR